MGVYQTECNGRLCSRAPNERKAIFEQAGYTVKIFEIPAKRAQQAVNDGTVDLMSAGTTGTPKLPSLFYSTYPDIYRRMVVFYLPSEQWAPSWPPKVDFKNARGVSKDITPLAKYFGLNVAQINNYVAGAKMVEMKRTDYWLDVYDTGIFTTSTEVKRQVLFAYPQHLIFRDDPRSHKLDKVHAAGLAKLLREKKYAELYLANLNLTPNSAFQGIPQDILHYTLASYQEKYPQLFNNTKASVTKPSKALTCGSSICTAQRDSDLCCTKNTDVDTSIASKADACGIDLYKRINIQTGRCHEPNLSGELDKDCPDMVNWFGQLEPGCCATQISGVATGNLSVCGQQNALLGCHANKYTLGDIPARPDGVTFRDCEGNWIINKVDQSQINRIKPKF